MGGRAWVVILNWNGKDYLRACLKAALAQTYPEYHVVVVDNASTDRSASIVPDEFPEATLVSLPQNLHFARGTNAGIEAALKDPACAYIATLNNDTQVDPEWLGAMVRSAEERGVGSVASKLLLMDHPDLLNGAGIRILRDGGAVDRGWLERDEGQYDRDPDVFGPSAGAALYRRHALETVGLFDEDFIAYLEDVDLAWRMRLAGLTSRFAGRSIVYHKHSASTAPTSPWKTYISERNRIWNLVQNYPRRYVVAAAPWNAARNLAALRRRARPERYPLAFGRSLPLRTVIEAHLRGRREAYRGMGRALAKRQLRSKYRRVSASDVGRWFSRYGVRIKDVPIH
ncbi:MAG TPA: glycosyltransferase family 2 protein [Thermoplasmata archaeon]|nr:glycosyltransferase family 2 protein [Thermoplasmata archaeon]